jgi:hypothetical protein
MKCYAIQFLGALFLIGVYLSAKNKTVDFECFAAVSWLSVEHSIF